MRPESPNGGWADYTCSYDTLEAALEVFRMVIVGHIQIVDTEGPPGKQIIREKLCRAESKKHLN